MRHFSDQNSEINQSETSLNKQNSFLIVQKSKIPRLKLFPLHIQKDENKLPGTGRGFLPQAHRTLIKLRTFWGGNFHIHPKDIRNSFRAAHETETGAR